ncbi:MAG: hypothetical protein ACRD1A_01900 [Terriglobales bacterium]
MAALSLLSNQLQCLLKIAAELEAQRRQSAQPVEAPLPKNMTLDELILACNAARAPEGRPALPPILE